MDWRLGVVFRPVRTASPRRRAQAQIVLQGQARIGHLACTGLAAQLLHELRALRQARGAQRMALLSRPPEGW